MQQDANFYSDNISTYMNERDYHTQSYDADENRMLYGISNRGKSETVLLVIFTTGSLEVVNHEFKAENSDACLRSGRYGLLALNGDPHAYYYYNERPVIRHRIHS